MSLEVQGIFAGKWLKLTYDIDKELISDSENNFKANLNVLMEHPEDVRISSGTRLDILMRSNPEVLYQLSDYRLENDNLTLYERLINVLGEIEEYPKIEEYVELVYSLHGIDDALIILKQR